MKRIVLGILFVLFVFSMSTGVFANVGAESDIAVENDVQLLSDSAIDAEILARINDLYAKVGNTYFNVDHGTGCGDGSDHGCPNCLLSAIINKTWFKNIFGSCSVEQFPESYYGIDRYSKDAYSCLGFSHFAQWYIFKESNSDYVYSQKIGTYSFNNSNIAKYAKIGDNLRLTSGYSSFGGHSAIYIGISSDGTGIDVLDCNYNTTYNCKVRKHTLPFTTYTYNYVTITRTTNRDSIVPNAEVPKNVKVSIYGTDVTVSWNASANASSYDVYLIQPPHRWEDVKYSQTVTTTSCTFHNVSEGFYNVFVVSRPNSSDVQSEWIGINVASKAPIAPVIKHNLDLGYTRSDTNVVISWEEVDTAESYSYYLTEYPEGYAYTTNTKSGVVTENQVVFSDLKNGVYTAFVHAKNNIGMSPQSNWIRFYVYEDEYKPIETAMFNGHIYALYDYEMSWSFAKELCENFGGHLVTITSKEENEFLEELIQKGIKDAYWLGATDFDIPSNQYCWITGESFDYENWMDGEPNNWGNDGEAEHFVEIRKSYDNKWNDVKNTSKTNTGFILEIEPDYKYITYTETFRGNRYLIIDKNTTWLDAKAYCEMLGGHLVTINTDDEQRFIDSFIKQGTRNWYYMGASGNNSKWTWIDGTDGQNIKWKDGVCEYDGYLMKYKTANYTSLNNSYYPASHIDNIGFICEVPVADIEAKVNYKKDTYTIKIDTYNIQNPYEVLVAGYKDNMFIACTSAVDGVASLSGDIDEIRVFAFEDLHKSLSPICDCEVIPSSDFITE